MGKTQKKPHQNRGHYMRNIEYKNRRREELQQQQKAHKAHSIKNYTGMQCQCNTCKTYQNLTVQKDIMHLMTGKLIARCKTCQNIRIFSIPDKIANNQRTKPVQKQIINACKQTGMRYHFENEYVILTGKTVRWYIPYLPYSKTVYFCNKHKRIWSPKPQFNIFYKQRSIRTTNAIYEIATYEKMINGLPERSSCDLTAQIQRKRLQDLCDKANYKLTIKEPFAYIETKGSKWKFDYHKDRITLLHKSKHQDIDKLTGCVLDYHVQFVSLDITIEDTIANIIDHETWADKNRPK